METKEKTEKEKLLDLFRYWCVGIFIIVFAAFTVYFGLFVSWSQALRLGLPIWGLTGIFCVAAYYIYKWYLTRKSAS
jgi:hypothetical protein